MDAINDNLFGKAPARLRTRSRIQLSQRSEYLSVAKYGVDEGANAVEPHALHVSKHGSTKRSHVGPCRLLQSLRRRGACQPCGRRLGDDGERAADSQRRVACSARHARRRENNTGGVLDLEATCLKEQLDTLSSRAHSYIKYGREARCCLRGTVGDTSRLSMEMMAQSAISRSVIGMHGVSDSIEVDVLL